MTPREYSPPILSIIFNVLGTLTLIGAVFCLGESVSTAIIAALIGIVSFGIAQAIDFLAQTAHSTDRLCRLFETSFSSRLKNIEDRLGPPASSTVRADSTALPSEPPKATLSPVAPTETVAPEQHEFFRSIDGVNSGPYSLQEMRQFRNEERIDDDTLIFRNGDKEWRPVGQFAEIVSKDEPGHPPPSAC